MTPSDVDIDGNRAQTVINEAGQLVSRPTGNATPVDEGGSLENFLDTDKPVDGVLSRQMTIL